MDVIDDNNADNNNNLERILTESLARVQDYRIDIQMVDVNDMSGNDISRYSADEGNTTADIAQPHDADIRGNQDANQSDENQVNSTVNDADEGIATTNNGGLPLSSGYNTRKSKKRKRHYNVNKNKQKWNKSYKRQKSTNTTKTDAENISQNGRNKHAYAKTAKTAFHNKQTLHRGNGLSKFFLPDKRPRKDIIVPATKFLLGGNISDPLNLNSLNDEALASSMNAVTPKSSPITTPPKVEVIIPPNIYDPLHLLDPVDSIEYEKQLVSPVKIRRLNKQRSRKKKIRKCLSSDLAADCTETNGEPVAETCCIPATSVAASAAIAAASVPNDTGSEAAESTDTNVEISSVVAHTEEKCRASRDLHLDLPPAINIFGRKRKNSENSGSTMTGAGSNAAIVGGANGKPKLRRFDSKDKIVSPVIPQPGAWKRPPKVLPTGAPRNRNRTTSASDNDVADEQNIKRTETAPADETKPTSAILSVVNKEQSPELNIPNIECEPSTSEPAESHEPRTSADDTIVAKQETVKYQHGNYAGQYFAGVQSLHNFIDVRLTVFMRHAYLFRGKDVLDVGCNVGLMTIAVANKLHPRSIVGVDIDRNLIARARRNLSMFQSIPDDDDTKAHAIKIQQQPSISATATAAHNDASNIARVSLASKKPKKERLRDHPNHFPVSFPICFGAIPRLNERTDSPAASPASGGQNVKTTEAIEPAEKCADGADDKKPKCGDDEKIDSHSNSFPANVFFRTLNYAVIDESQMCADRQQYDLILCLSLTKHVHMNYGDLGLQMTFKRMFNQLRPGGKLILEAQNWASYRKRKKLTPNIYKNYKNIEFFPSNFHEYLLSPEVGFSHSYTLGIPRHASKGFYRPIQLYIKGDFTPSQVRWSDAYHPQTPYEPVGQYTQYVDPMRIARPYNWTFGKSSRNYHYRDTPQSSSANQYNTPSYGIGSTSRYYNPLETDNYLPSYDNVVRTRHYCFQSPLYSTVWSPPASGRRSASQTPLFGSIRRVEAEETEHGTRHLYLTPRAFDGSGSSRSIDDSNSASPQTHVYAIGSSRSVREADSDTNTNSPKEHVYAFQ